MSDIIIYPTNESKSIGGSLSGEKKCFGIDLGTTTTIMCYADSENVDLASSTIIPIQFVKIIQQSPFEYNSPIESEKVASILGVHNGKPYVGTNLYHLKGHSEFEYKKNIFYHWKLELGIDHHPMYPDAITEKINMPYKVAGVILNYIRKLRFGDTPLSNTIITVPASFQANQRKDVLKAAEMARINTSENMLIDEPNAAFLGYFNRLPDQEKVEWSKSVRNKNVLVIDFGGGTLDLSILNVDFKRETGITISNRAISRYNDLGGQDIDTLIAEEFLVPKLKKIFDKFDHVDSIDIKDIILPQLALIGESLKIGISDKVSLQVVDQNVSSVNIDSISYLHTDCVLRYKSVEYDLGDITITAKDFQNLFVKLFAGKEYKFKYIDKTVSTISASISDILKKAVLGLDQVDYTLFVGGSSFNPFLHSLCEEKLSGSKTLTSHEPDKLVAEGAAVYSYFLNVHNISLISPITSDTIGIIIKGDRFFPILERGQSLPKRVTVPDFQLQSNMSSEVVVPVCINGVDFPIGEIRSHLDTAYPHDAVVAIDAEVTIDKVFKMRVSVEGDLIGEAEFQSPYSMGKMTEEELEIFKQKEELNRAKLSKNHLEEKMALRSLIWMYYEVGNYRGSIECAEEYVKRFDDQDESIWNMIYIGNNEIGRLEAAKRALEKALELNPDAAYLNYNYSIMLGRNDSKEALKYLQGLNEDLKNDVEIRCRIILLKNDLDENIKSEALNVVSEYKNNPNHFTEFAKKNLLSRIFRIADEPYAYVDPKTQRKSSDQRKYLDTNNLPI